MSRLDELVTRIESMNIDESAEQSKRLLADLEAAARLDHGQELLVERFGSSSNVVVLRSLSFVLAQLAADEIVDNLPVILDFVEVIDTDDASTLINSVSALKKHRPNSTLVETLQARRPAVWRLIRAGLIHSSKLVHLTVLEYLEQLYYDGHLRREWAESSLSQLTHTLADWCETGDDDIARDACVMLNLLTRPRTSGETNGAEM